MNEPYVKEWLRVNIKTNRHSAVVARSAPVQMAGFKSRLGDCAGRWRHWAIMLNCCPTMLTIERLAMCSTRGGSQGTHNTFTSEKCEYVKLKEKKS